MPQAGLPCVSSQVQFSACQPPGATGSQVDLTSWDPTRFSAAEIGVMFLYTCFLVLGLFFYFHLKNCVSFFSLQLRSITFRLLPVELMLTFLKTIFGFH